MESSAISVPGDQFKKAMGFAKLAKPVIRPSATARETVSSAAITPKASSAAITPKASSALTSFESPSYNPLRISIPDTREQSRHDRWMDSDDFRHSSISRQLQNRDETLCFVINNDCLTNIIQNEKVVSLVTKAMYIRQTLRTSEKQAYSLTDFNRDFDELNTIHLEQLDGMKLRSCVSEIVHYAQYGYDIHAINTCPPDDKKNTPKECDVDNAIDAVLQSLPTYIKQWDIELSKLIVALLLINSAMANTSKPRSMYNYRSYDNLYMIKNHIVSCLRYYIIHGRIDDYVPYHDEAGTFLTKIHVKFYKYEKPFGNWLFSDSATRIFSNSAFGNDSILHLTPDAIDAACAEANRVRVLLAKTFKQQQRQQQRQPSKGGKSKRVKRTKKVKSKRVKRRN